MPIALGRTWNGFALDQPIAELPCTTVLPDRYRGVAASCAGRVLSCPGLLCEAVAPQRIYVDRQRLIGLMTLQVRIAESIVNFSAGEHLSLSTVLRTFDGFSEPLL